MEEKKRRGEEHAEERGRGREGGEEEG